MRQIVRKKAARQGHYTLTLTTWLLLVDTNVSDRVRFALKSAVVVGFRIVPKVRLALTTPTNLVAPSLLIALVSASNSTVHSAAASRPSSARGKMTVRYASTIPAMIAP